VARHAKLKAELDGLAGTKFSILKQIEEAESRLRQDDKEKLERELSKVREKIGKTRETINERKRQLEGLLPKAGYEVRIV
jgi:prefoldin subunit 5